MAERNGRGMNQDQTLEEVMQKIRARVEERKLRTGTIPPAGQFSPSGKNRETGFQAETVDNGRLGIPANDLSFLRIEIDTALEGTRRVGQINPRNPGILTPLIQFFKKVMRRSLSWYTRPIHYFQGGVIRALQRIEAILESHERSLRAVSGEINRQSEVIETNSAELSASLKELGAVNNELNANLGRRSESLERELLALGEKLASLQLSTLALTDRAAVFEQRLSQATLEMASAQEERSSQLTAEIMSLRMATTKTSETMREIQLQGRLRDRDVRRFVHDLRSGAIVSSEPERSAPVPPMFPAGVQRETDFDYFGFEDLYRGDEADIGRRQKAYLEYFRGRENVLDVGCGRGEFLELLRESNISGKGVELGTDQYLLCKEKGLDVAQQDLFSYLESIPDESLGGLFSAQVIEHLTASDQLRYVALAHQKTMPGSPVILETINAQCVWAVMRNFFLDPTHVRPVHPETLKFAMESVQFQNVEVHFSSPMKDRLIPALQAEGVVLNLAEFNQRIQDLNELLYGNQDYAAIGWK